MRLLLDEMISPKVAVRLRALGHDVYAIAERADLVQLPDEQVLALAAEENRVVVTFDIADFAALAGQWADQRRTHRGILFVSTASFRQDRGLVGALVRALDVAARGDRLPGPGRADFLARQEP